MPKRNYEENEKVISSIRITRIIIAAVIVVIIAVLLYVNRESISIDNFNRFLSRLDFTFSSSESSKNIEFTPSGQNKYALYKDSIAILSPDGLKIFDNSNKQLLHVQRSFQNPVLLTSDKYMLAYDQGGKDISVTNSFAELFKKTYDDDIICAALNDEGTFAAAVKEKGYASVLHVYDKRFNEIYTYSSTDKYITSIDISDNSKYIVVAAVSNSSAEYTSSVIVLNTDKEKVYASCEMNTEAVYSVEFNGSYRINAITNKKIAAYDFEMQEKNKYEFSGKTIVDIDTGCDNYTSVLLDAKTVNERYQLINFSADCKVLNETKINDEILYISAAKDRFGVMLDNRIDIYDMPSGKKRETKKCGSNYKQMYMTYKNGIYLISNNYADKISG